MENLISEDMKTKTMINREKRIEKIKNDIKELEERLEREKETLKEEQQRAIEKSMNTLEKTLSVDESNLTLDEIINFIQFIKNDKELTLEETKRILDQMPSKENTNQHHYQR